MFHVKHEAWTRDAQALGVQLGPPELEELIAYEGHLQEVAVPRGLIGRSDRGRLWERHILDGLRAAPEIAPGDSVLDLGSGAGIPGIPLAIALPNRVTLVEARSGRAAFLEAVVDRIGLTNVDVIHGRAEGLGRRFHVCVARALAPATETWSVAEPLLEPDGSLIYWAGSGFEIGGLEPLGVSWRLSTHPGLADSGPLVIMGRQ